MEQRNRTLNWLKQMRRRKLRREKLRRGSSSSSVEPPQKNLDGSSSSSVDPPEQKLKTPAYSLPDMDPLEEAKYFQQVEESRGFDVDNFYLPYGGIMPIRCDYSEVVKGKMGLHCYNYDKGKKLVFKGVTKANALSFMFLYITLEASDPENNDAPVTIQTHLWHASPETFITCSCSIKGSGEDKYESDWDPNDVGEFYNGVMPNWIEDDALTGRQYYVVKRSDLEENDWLYLYMEVAAYAKWYSNMVDQMPLELEKVVVQTEEEDVESSMKLKSSNAIFFITFKVCGGATYRGIIRQTRDGRPQHLSLEVVCEMAK